MPVSSNTVKTVRALYPDFQHSDDKSAFYKKIGHDCSSKTSHILTKALNFIGLRRDHYENLGKKLLQETNAYSIIGIEHNTTYKTDFVFNAVKGYTKLISEKEVFLIRENISLAQYWNTHNPSPLMNEWLAAKNQLNSAQLNILDEDELRVFKLQTVLDSVSPDNNIKDNLAQLISQKSTSEEKAKLIESFLQMAALDKLFFPSFSPILNSLTLQPLLTTPIEVNENSIKARKLLLKIDELTSSDNKDSVATLLLEGDIHDVEYLETFLELLKTAKDTGNLSNLAEIKERTFSPRLSHNVNIVILSAVLNGDTSLLDGTERGIENNFRKQYDSFIAYPELTELLKCDQSNIKIQEAQLKTGRQILSKANALSSSPARKHYILILKRAFDAPSAAIRPNDFKARFEALSQVNNSINVATLKEFYTSNSDRLAYLPLAVSSSFLKGIKTEDLRDSSALSSRLDAIYSLVQDHGVDRVSEYVNDLNRGLGDFNIGENIDNDTLELNYRKYLAERTPAYREAMITHLRGFDIHDKVKFMQRPAGEQIEALLRSDSQYEKIFSAEFVEALINQPIIKVDEAFQRIYDFAKNPKRNDFLSFHTNLKTNFIKNRFNESIAREALAEFIVNSPNPFVLDVNSKKIIKEIAFKKWLLQEGSSFITGKNVTPEQLRIYVEHFARNIPTASFFDSNDTKSVRINNYLTLFQRGLEIVNDKVASPRVAAEAVANYINEFPGQALNDRPTTQQVTEADKEAILEAAGKKTIDTTVIYANAKDDPLKFLSVVIVSTFKGLLTEKDKPTLDHLQATIESQREAFKPLVVPFVDLVKPFLDGPAVIGVALPSEVIKQNISLNIDNIVKYLEDNKAPSENDPFEQPLNFLYLQIDSDKFKEILKGKRFAIKAAMFSLVYLYKSLPAMINILSPVLKIALDKGVDLALPYLPKQFATPERLEAIKSVKLILAAMVPVAGPALATIIKNHPDLLKDIRKIVSAMLKTPLDESSKLEIRYSILNIIKDVLIDLKKDAIIVDSLVDGIMETYGK